MLLLPHVSFLSHTHLKSRNSSWASVRDLVQLRAFSFHSLTMDPAPSLYPHLFLRNSHFQISVSLFPTHSASFPLPLSLILALLRNAAVLQVGRKHDSLLRQRLIGGEGQGFAFRPAQLFLIHGISPQASDEYSPTFTWRGSLEASKGTPMNRHLWGVRYSFLEEMDWQIFIKPLLGLTLEIP